MTPPAPALPCEHGQENYRETMSFDACHEFGSVYRCEVCGAEHRLTLQRKNDMWTEWASPDKCEVCRKRLGLTTPEQGVAWLRDYWGE